MSNFPKSGYAACLVLALLLGCKDDFKPNQAENNATTQFWIKGAAGRIFVDRGGAGGVPVVIVHSLAGNTTQWQAQLDHLRKNRLAIAFDMRGHGQSEPVQNNDFSLAAMTQDVSAVVDSLGIAKFVLMGHSYGGGVIATYAGVHPERVAGLLFVDPIGDTSKLPRQAVEQFLSVLRTEAYAETVEAHWRGILLNADSAVTQQVIAGLRETPKEVVISAFASALQFDPVAALQSYQGPMHLISSGLPEDPNNTSELHQVLPHLSRVKLPETSHWLQMDRPKEFNLRMDEFLNRIKAAE